MIKECAKLKYLCKCRDNKNPFTYKGSGTYWRRHILKYSLESITTTILGHYDCNSRLREAGEYYSSLYDIVHSKEWANLIPEIGDGGTTIKNKIRIYNIDNHNQKCISIDQDIPEGWKRGLPPGKVKMSPEKLKKMVAFHTGRKRSEQTKENMRNSIRSKRITTLCDKCNKSFTFQNISRHQLKCEVTNVPRY